MSGPIQTQPVLRYFTNTGAVLASGKVYTYAAGTVTPKTVYKDRAMTVAHTNPIILDTNGCVGFGIFGSGVYKIDVQDSGGTSITGYPIDNVSWSDTIVAENMAALRAFSVAAADSVVLKCHTTIGDGGGGDFIWDAASSAADNDGTVINPTGNAGAGRWLRLFPAGEMNAEWFGQYDADAGAAINKAAAALSLLGGGTINLPGKDVTYTTPINLAGGRNSITLDGKGKATILRANLSTIGIDCNGSSDLVLKDFQLVGMGGCKVGILLAKASASEEGIRHKLFNVITDGAFTKAAVYNYASEENRFYSCYLVNRDTGASSAYWSTNDNAGTDESIANVYGSMANNTRSNSENYFHGCNFVVFGTGANTIRLRGVTDSSWDANYLQNSNIGNAHIYVDANTSGTSRVSFTNFRGEPGVTKYPSYGIHFVGTISCGDWIVERGFIDVQTKMIFVAGNMNFFSSRIEQFSDSGNGRVMDFYQLDSCTLRYGQTVTVRDIMQDNWLFVDPSKLTAGTDNNDNVVYDILTGTPRFPKVNVDAKTGNAIYNLYANGVLKWQIVNTPSAHELYIYNASAQAKFVLEQGGGLTVASLAGVGSRTVVADANGKITAP